jgi:hypothetical protein
MFGRGKPNENHIIFTFRSIDIESKTKHIITMSMLFWAMTPSGLVGRQQSFGGTYCLHLQPWRRDTMRLRNIWYLPVGPHGITAQKRNIKIFTAVRTSNLTGILHIPDFVNTHGVLSRVQTSCVSLHAFSASQKYSVH